MSGLRGSISTPAPLLDETHSSQRLELLEARLNLLEEKLRFLERSHASKPAPRVNPISSPPRVEEDDSNDLGLTIEQYMLEGLY